MSKRRLIGPTIVSLVLCGLWTDYVFFADSRWSVVGFLAKAFAILGAIFSFLFKPELYGWTQEIIFPTTLIAVAIVLLSLVILRAKAAMKDATPDPETSGSSVGFNSAPAPTLSIAQEAAVAVARQRWFGGLFGRCMVIFMALTAALSVAFCWAVYRYLYSAMDQNLKTRAEAMALALAEISAQHFAGGTFDGLPAELGRYGPDRIVAYAYVEDASGRIVGHTPADLPRYLRRDFPGSAVRAIRGVEVEYRGEPVYEIAKRFGGPNGGFAHLGLWRAAADEETRRAVIPIVLTTVALLAGTLAVSALIVRRLIRPFLRLVEDAGRISKGDWVVPLELKRADEIGDIARSLERLRSSLRAVLARLDPRQQSTESGL